MRHGHLSPGNVRPKIEVDYSAYGFNLPLFKKGWMALVEARSPVILEFRTAVWRAMERLVDITGCP
jgi:hypothetical protein